MIQKNFKISCQQGKYESTFYIYCYIIGWHSNKEQIISGCPIDGAISVLVDCGFGSYRWFVHITTLLHCGTPERPQRHLYC